MIKERKHLLTFEVTDIASEELTRILGAQSAKDKQLILYFRGYG